MSFIIPEFKRIVKETTGKELQQRKDEISQWSSALSNNHIGARTFLEHNIVELRFDRKHPDGKPTTTRRMICTRNFWFAKRFAKYFGNVETPSQPMHRRGDVWYKQRKILLIFDLIECKYRMVHLKKWKILDFITLTRSNSDILNEFMKKLNPTRISETSKQSFYKK